MVRFFALIFLTVLIGCDTSNTSRVTTNPLAEKAKKKQHPEESGNQPSEQSTQSSTAETDIEQKIEVSPDAVMEWPHFRGPEWRSTSLDAAIPLEWKNGENIVWKTRLPGRGVSSPIVVGDRVFVTAFTGYGMTPRNPGKVSKLQHHVICVNKITGEQIWTRTIQGSYATQKLSENCRHHGFASSTMVSDGESVFAFFGVSGVFAFDIDGNFKWQKGVGTRNDNFGSSASLTLFRNLLIVNASIESQSMYALHKETGKAIWKLDEVYRSWSAPVIGQTEDGENELVLSATDVVFGVDPLTGEKLWTCEGIADYTVAVPVIEDGIAYVSGGKQKKMMAIRLGGRGDVTASHKLWEVPEGANVPSMVVHDGMIFLCSDNGIMQVYETETGEKIEARRIGSKSRVFASPILIGDHIFLPVYKRGVVAITADEDIEVVARNTLGDKTPFQSSIAASGNNLFVRTEGNLYCIGQAGEAANSSKIVLDSEQDVIVPHRKFDFDEKTRRPKQYLSYFITDPDEMAKHILRPYDSVITPEQTAQSTIYIKENHEPFLKLREQYLHLNWRYMRGNIEEAELIRKLDRIDRLTINHNHAVRKLVKDQFSPEQLAKHRRDAAIRNGTRAKVETRNQGDKKPAGDLP